MKPIDQAREYLNQALSKIDHDKDPTFQIMETLKSLKYIEDELNSWRNKYLNEVTK